MSPQGSGGQPAWFRPSLPVKFVLTACAATAAETVTFPLDITKTRLQIQGEAVDRFRKTAKPYRGMIQTAIGIVREEGLFKLWQGVTPAIYRHIVYSGVRMVAYEQLRDSLLKKNKDGYFPLWKAVVGGMVSGAIGQFFASPTDLVKVQMQMEGRRRLEGKPPRIHGVYHAFVKILSEGGIQGLWAGWIPNVQRAALVSLGDLTTYDTVKHFLLRNTTLKDGSLCHGLSSICAGLVAATMGTPADVIKTRIMNQTRDKQGSSNNSRGMLKHSSNGTFTNKSAKNSPMLTVDAHLRNKKEDMLLHGRLNHLNHGHRIVLSALQQKSTIVTEELQNLLRQKSILQNFKFDDLIFQLRNVSKGDKHETNSDWNSNAVGMNPLFIERGKMAASSTQTNLQSGRRHASLLGTWAGLNGRTSPNSLAQDEFDARFLAKQHVKKRSHMPSHTCDIASGPLCFRRSKSTMSLRRNVVDGGSQSLTHKELRRMVSIDNIYQNELEKQKYGRLQEREHLKKFMDEKMKEKINNFIMALDQNLK